MNIVLIGMMGSGKTAVGKITAERLGWAFYDTDHRIEETEGIAISEIFNKKGEAVFREIEKKVVREIAEKDQSVIATGGGAPCDPENWEALSKNGRVIWLSAEPSTLVRRLKKESKGARPLLADDKTMLRIIKKVLEKRTAFYKKADWVLETDPMDLEQASAKIIEWFKDQKQSNQ